MDELRLDWSALKQPLKNCLNECFCSLQRQAPFFPEVHDETCHGAPPIWHGPIPEGLCYSHLLMELTAGAMPISRPLRKLSRPTSTLQLEAGSPMHCFLPSHCRTTTNKTEKAFFETENFSPSPNGITACVAGQATKEYG